MVFLFTLKGFLHKSGVFYFSVFIFLLWLLFKYIVLFTYMGWYSHLRILFIRRQETLPGSSVGAIEVDH